MVSVALLSLPPDRVKLFIPLNWIWNRFLIFKNCGAATNNYFHDR